MSAKNNEPLSLVSVLSSGVVAVEALLSSFCLLFPSAKSLVRVTLDFVPSSFWLLLILHLLPSPLFHFLLSPLHSPSSSLSYFSSLLPSLPLSLLSTRLWVHENQECHKKLKCLQGRGGRRGEARRARNRCKRKRGWCVDAR